MFTVYSGGETKDHKENTIEKIDDEPEVIEKKNSRFCFLKNTIEKLDDEPDVTEKEELKTSPLRIPLKNIMMNPR